MPLQGMSADLNSAGGAHAAAASSRTSSSFASLTSSRASPFSSVTPHTKPSMATPSFLPQSQAFRPVVSSQSTYALPISAAHPFDRDAIMPVGTPFAHASSVLIRRLPLNTSEESLRLMVVFSKELVAVDVLRPDESEDAGFRSAILRFKTPAGAHEARNILNGKPNISNDADMIVEVLGSSPQSSKRYPIDTSVSGGASTAASSAASSATSSRQASRFNGGFQPLDTMSPSMGAAYAGAELANPDSQTKHYQSLFSPQSPIGNHLTDRARISGKTLINDADDDETGELLKDTLAYADNGALGGGGGGGPHQQRRATAPHIPIARMGALSINTPNTPSPASMPQYGHPGMAPPLPPHASAMSPTGMNQTGAAVGFNHHYRGHNFPPVNPADQNPPCNTLYVGNLPIDTSEEELKAMFSKQRGYKRLCFRTKQNGPMCFVEFEDVSFATKALHELYGHPLHNSVKGGIRLSFSKNPLGVRSGQNPNQNSSGGMGTINGIMAGSGAGTFASANGPPPGLSAPPGLGAGRAAFGSSPSMSAPNGSPYIGGPFSAGANNVWNNYNGAMTAGGPASAMTSSSSAFPASYMMGR